MTTTVTDPRIDPDHLIFEGKDTLRPYQTKKGEPKIRGPIFTVSEMAKFFFARTNHWIRWLESNGKMAEVIKEPCLVCNQNRIVQTGVDKHGKAKWQACPACTKQVGARRDEKMGNRIYTLSDIEEIAHALAANGTITGSQLRYCLRTLQAQGEMHEIL